MSILDWLLIIFLFLGFASGFHFGFIFKLGSFIGTIVGIIVAGRYYDSVDTIFGGGIGGKIVAFLIIISIVSTIIGLLFRVVDKVFKIISIIPGVKFLNRFLGALFGLLQRFVVFSILLYFVDKFHDAEAVAKILDPSKLAPTLIAVGNFLSPMLPDALQHIQSLI